MQSQPHHSKWWHWEHPLQSHIPAGEALHAITLEKHSFLLETQRTKWFYLKHMFGLWIKRISPTWSRWTAQHEKKNLVWPKHPVDCYFQTKDRRHEQNSSACSNATGPPERSSYRAVTCEEHCSLSQSKLQGSAALICMASVLGEMTLNAEQQDPNSNGLCSWTSNTSKANQKKQNCHYKTTLLHECGEHYHDTVLNTDTCSSPGSLRQKILLMSHLGEKTWKLKGHSVLFKCKRIWIFLS